MTRFSRTAPTPPTGARVLPALIAAALITLLAGCASIHLSDETGKAYRAAIEAQAASTAEPLPPMTAADARRVLRIHTGAGANGSASASGGGASIPAVNFGGLSSGLGGGPSGGGMWQGASGGIRLEAK